MTLLGSSLVLFLLVQPAAPPFVPLPKNADAQDAMAVEADFQELETASRVQDWATTSQLAEKTLRDFKGYVKASGVSELSDTERALAASLAHLGDIEESAGPERQGEVEHDWKDFKRDYGKLRDSAIRGGGRAPSLAPVDASVAVLQNALGSKDWATVRQSAGEARKALRAAYPAGVLDPTREQIGACLTHLEDVREATDQKIGTEPANDTRRAKAEWESVRGRLAK